MKSTEALKFAIGVLGIEREDPDATPEYRGQCSAAHTALTRLWKDEGGLLEQQEEAVGFDRSLAEEAIDKAVAKRLGSAFGYAFFDSANPGVLAMERPDFADSRKLDWQEIAQEAADATGFGVLAVDTVDWSFDDRCDEEALMIVFDTPATPDDYRNHDTMIEPVEPAKKAQEAV